MFKRPKHLILLRQNVIKTIKKFYSIGPRYDNSVVAGDRTVRVDAMVKPVQEFPPLLLDVEQVDVGKHLVRVLSSDL
jgi:hypothetical protein